MAHDPLQLPTICASVPGYAHFVESIQVAEWCNRRAWDHHRIGRGAIPY
jgi:hypothetical protein